MIGIRAAAKADIPAINRIYNQASVRRFTLGLPYTSVNSSRRHFGAAPAPHARLVACGADGAVLGEACLARDASPRRAHAGALGVMVAEEARRQGIGRALLSALVDLADNWLNLHRLELNVFANNQPALALYHSLGFETEVHERHDAMQDGVLADSCLMARLRPGLAADRAAPPPRPAPAPHQPLTLRGIEPDDLPAIIALMNLPGVRHGTSALPFQTEEGQGHLA